MSKKEKAETSHFHSKYVTHSINTGDFCQIYKSFSLQKTGLWQTEKSFILSDRIYVTSFVWNAPVIASDTRDVCKMLGAIPTAGDLFALLTYFHCKI